MLLKLQKNTRRSQRQWFNTSVQVFTQSDCIDALGVNVSEGGMCLFAMANLRLGSQIQVQFCAPQSKELVCYPATIRHRALYLYGVEFLVGVGNRSEQMGTGKRDFGGFAG